jgi:AcrR family transcriptional regulator
VNDASRAKDKAAKGKAAKANGRSKAAAADRPTTAKVDRRKAPLTKAKILDAAELLFLERGFHGASIRDISKAADVQIALAYYHFGTKEDLFRAVIDRRAAENASGMLAALRQLQQDPERARQPEELFRAFLQPVVDRALTGGEGWHNYIRLMAHIANQPQDKSYITPFNENYDSLMQVFVDHLRNIRPELADEDLYWAFYFFQAAVSHILTQSGMVDRQSGGLCRSKDLNTIVDKLARVFGAGLNGLGPQP